MGGNCGYVEEIQESPAQARLLGLNRRRIQFNPRIREAEVVDKRSEIYKTGLYRVKGLTPTTPRSLTRAIPPLELSFFSHLGLRYQLVEVLNVTIKPGQDPSRLDLRYPLSCLVTLPC